MGEVIQFTPKEPYQPSKVEVALRRLGMKHTPTELPANVIPIRKTENIVKLRKS